MFKNVFGIWPSSLTYNIDIQNLFYRSSLTSKIKKSRSKINLFGGKRSIFPASIFSYAVDNKDKNETYLLIAILAPIKLRSYNTINQMINVQLHELRREPSLILLYQIYILNLFNVI